MTGGLRLAWQISVSVLLLVTPFALIAQEDAMLAMEEKNMMMQQSANEVCDIFHPQVWGVLAAPFSFLRAFILWCAWVSMWDIMNPCYYRRKKNKSVEPLYKPMLYLLL